MSQHVDWEWLESFAAGGDDAESLSATAPTSAAAPSAASRDDASGARGGHQRIGEASAGIEQHLVWPREVRYINTVDWSEVDEADKALLHTARLPGVESRAITSPLHPCRGQRGLFATRSWSRFSILGEYTGVMRSPVDRVEGMPGGTSDVDKDAKEKEQEHVGSDWQDEPDIHAHVSPSILEEQEHVGSDYVAAVFKSATWTPVIDAGGAGNETRFINDFRGHPQGRPNCCFSQTYVAGRPALMVVVTQDVQEGDELLVDYGEAFWQAS